MTTSSARPGTSGSSLATDVAIDLVVSGATGRMGRTLGRLIGEADELRALGGISLDAPNSGGDDLYPRIVGMDAAAGLLRDADAVLDFSAPDYLDALLDRHARDLAGRALLVGTTGLEDDALERLRDLAGSAAVLVAPNFSVGVNLLLGLVERAARALPATRYDVELVGTDLRRKEDAPSGTGLALGEAVATGRDDPAETTRRDGRSGRTGERPAGEVGYHAVRGGDVVGEHAVHFLGERERIALSHSAMSRDLFADGALAAARWLAGREAGWYTMRDVLGV